MWYIYLNIRLCIQQYLDAKEKEKWENQERRQERASISYYSTDVTASPSYVQRAHLKLI
jgi:hypothetical protein